MKKTTLLIITVLTSITGRAQSDSTYTMDYITKSTKFAWLTLGIEVLAEPGGGTQFLESGTLRETSFQNAFTPRLTIGGIHFWGTRIFT